MIHIFIADGTDGTNQPKVVQEVLADLKIFLFDLEGPSINACALKMIESRRAIKKLDQSVDDLEGSAVHPEVGELIMCNSYSSSGQVANLTSERIDWSIHGRWDDSESEGE